MIRLAGRGLIARLSLSPSPASGRYTQRGWGWPILSGPHRCRALLDSPTTRRVLQFAAAALY